MPTDEQLIAFLKEESGQSLAQICTHFSLPYCYSTVRPGPKGETYGYTTELRALRNQLQRLRRARKLWCSSTKWEVR